MKVFLTLLFAAVIAAVHGQTCSKKSKQRMWIIAVGPSYGTLDYLDSDDGSVDGWGQAVIKAACAGAGIHCRIVYAPYSHCLVSDDPTYQDHPRLGTGLQLGYLDACHTFFPTRERRDNAIFSDGFFRDEDYRLYSRFSPNVNRQDLRIAFAPGPGDEYCLRRLLDSAGVTLRDFNSQVTWVSSNRDAFARLGNPYHLVFENPREMVVFGGVRESDYRTYDLNNDGSSSGDRIRCSEGPAGLMARVDSWELIEAFNYGLRVIKDNGVYEAICDDPKYDWTDRFTPWHTTWCTRD